MYIIRSFFLLFLFFLSLSLRYLFFLSLYFESLSPSLPVFFFYECIFPIDLMSFSVSSVLALDTESIDQVTITISKHPPHHPHPHPQRRHQPPLLPPHSSPLLTLPPSPRLPWLLTSWLSSVRSAFQTQTPSSLIFICFESSMFSMNIAILSWSHLILIWSHLQLLISPPPSILCLSLFHVFFSVSCLR